jgi:hypothetical protein
MLQNSDLRFPPLNTVNVYSVESLGSVISAGRFANLATSSGTIGGARVVIYIPFTMYEPATALKMSIIVGATNTGNVDVGIYNNVKTRLINSGSTALGTANTLQTFDITDTPLTPGSYYMAVSLENAAGTIFRATPADEQALCAFVQYTETPGAFGLPATANWAVSTLALIYFPSLAIHFNTLV